MKKQNLFSRFKFQWSKWVLFLGATVIAFSTMATFQVAHAQGVAQDQPRQDALTIANQEIEIIKNCPECLKVLSNILHRPKQDQALFVADPKAFAQQFPGILPELPTTPTPDQTETGGIGSPASRSVTVGSDGKPEVVGDPSTKNTPNVTETEMIGMRKLVLQGLGQEAGTEVNAGSSFGPQSLSALLNSLPGQVGSRTTRADAGNPPSGTAGPDGGTQDAPPPPPTPPTTPITSTDPKNAPPPASGPTAQPFNEINLGSQPEQSRSVSAGTPSFLARVGDFLFGPNVPKVQRDVDPNSPSSYQGPGPTPEQKAQLSTGGRLPINLIPLSRGGGGGLTQYQSSESPDQGSKTSPITAAQIQTANQIKAGKTLYIQPVSSRTGGGFGMDGTDTHSGDAFQRSGAGQISGTVGPCSLPGATCR